jgi:AAA+ ATPase superfamily predicted ATPase
MIEAATRLQGVEQLIDQKQYFVIHAARQSGKTTYLKDLANRFNATEKYYTFYCSLERMQGIEDPIEGIPAIVKTMKSRLRFSNIPHCTEFAKDADYSDFTSVLNTELTLFCMLLDKPLVVLFDEADCLSEGTLISFLRQLRDGYNSRPEQAFPHSIALVGIRNIRDFKAKIRSDKDSMDSTSPFNIVTKTYTLQNFTKKEITQLYRQHTDETGQIFEEDAIELIYEQTQGQPRLVNAIAREVIVEILQSDYTKPITTKLVNKAKHSRQFA